jgi:hypothetical protein
MAIRKTEICGYEVDRHGQHPVERSFIMGKKQSPVSTPTALKLAQI